MVMVPDLEAGFVDPFWEVSTLSFICATLEADTRHLFPYDPRNIARRAEEHLRHSGVADSSRWGPEFEFYLFDGVSYENGMNVASYRVESAEADWSSGKLGSGYNIPRHGGYHAIPPQDHLYNARSRITMALQAMGIEVKYHHHEVGGPGQCEIETRFMPMLRAGDTTMLVKYVTRMTATAMGMTATFMPKPLYGEAGSGMHFHQQLWKNGINLFFDSKGHGSTSELARSYIAGLLLHGGAVMAFTNPSTNSYRRLIPGFEAPVSAFFSVGNRSAAIRIPNTPTGRKRRFGSVPDAVQPYLAIAAQLMAGLDGIKQARSVRGFGGRRGIFTWPAEAGEDQGAPTRWRGHQRSRARSWVPPGGRGLQQGPHREVDRTQAVGGARGPQPSPPLRDRALLRAVTSSRADSVSQACRAEVLPNGECLPHNWVSRRKATLTR
jgi:glutamine synthetase